MSTPVGVCPHCRGDVLRWKNPEWHCLKCFKKSSYLDFISMDMTKNSQVLNYNEKHYNTNLAPMDYRWDKLRTFDSFIRQINYLNRKGDYDR